MVPHVIEQIGACRGLKEGYFDAFYAG